MRLPVLMVIVAYLLSVGVDIFIWWRIRCRVPASRPLTCHNTQDKTSYASTIYAVVSILCWAWLTVIVCLPKRGDADIIPVMWMLYAYMTIYLAKLVYCLIAAIGLIPMIWHKKERPLGLLIGVPAAVLVFFVMWWGTIWGRSQIQVVNVEVRSKRVPEAFNAFRIAQISDLHVGTWGNDTAFISRFVDRVNSLRPDMIVFTGDIVNRRSRELDPFIPVLKRLHAPLGVYGVLGNHDYGDYYDWSSQSEHDADNKQLAEKLRGMGWRMLNNEHRTIRLHGDSIMLIGVENWGDPPFKTYGDLKKATANTPQSDNLFKILLTHNPEHWRQEVASQTDIDLTLSGHTHAMQLIIKLGDWKWSPAKYRYETWGGQYEDKGPKGTQTLYVNIGAGEVGMPFRIGADPEITLITLRSE